MRLAPLVLVALAPLVACYPAAVTAPLIDTTPPVVPAPPIAPVVKIRGPLEATSASQPLVIIDGQVVSMSFSALDIESIEIIKGAAAATLYGDTKCPPIVIRTKRPIRASPAKR